MSAKISLEILQETYTKIQKTMNELELLGDYIKNANSKLPEWTDKKSEEFRELMDKVANLTVEPNQSLGVSVNAMKKMEIAIEKYNNIRLI